MQQMIMENKSWYLQISMVAQTFNLQQTTKVPHTWAFSLTKSLPGKSKIELDGLELWTSVVLRGVFCKVLMSRLGTSDGDAYRVTL